MSKPDTFGTVTRASFHRRRFLLGLTLASVVVLAVAAAGHTSTVVGRLSSAGGTFTILQPAEPRGLDQNVDSNPASGAIRNLVVQDLVASNPVNHFPDPSGLLTGWKRISPLVWKFNVRVTRFGDGEIFDAGMAAWDIGNVVAQTKVFSYHYVQNIVSAHHIGAHTLIVNTKIPIAYLPTVLTIVQALPRAYFLQQGETAFSHAPVGTGPFIFKQWVPGQYIELVRNPHYYHTPPRLQDVKFIWAIDDNTRRNLLETGAANIASSLAPNDTVTSGYHIVEHADEFNVALAENEHLAPFSDVRLRKAVARAINRTALVHAVFGGPKGATAYQNLFIPQFKSAQLPKKDYLTYNPAAAQALVKAVGSVPTIDFTWPVGDYTNDNQVGLAITGMLQAVGFQVNEHPLPVNTYNTQLLANHLSGVILVGGSLPLADESGVLDSKYLTTSVITYCAPGTTVDGLAEKARSMADGPKRVAVYNQIEKILIVDNACPIPLYLQNDFYGVSNHVSGFVPYANPNIAWRSLEYVSLK